MGCAYLSNDNRTIDMDVDHELKTNLSHKEIRVLLLHEFRLSRRGGRVQTFSSTSTAALRLKYEFLKRLLRKI